MSYVDRSLLLWEDERTIDKYDSIMEFLANNSGSYINYFDFTDEGGPMVIMAGDEWIKPQDLPAHAKEAWDDWVDDE